MIETGTPKTDASTSAEMYGLERITATGSMAGPDAAGSLIAGNPAHPWRLGQTEAPGERVQYARGSGWASLLLPLAATGRPELLVRSHKLQRLVNHMFAKLAVPVGSVITHCG